MTEGMLAFSLTGMPFSALPKALLRGERCPRLYVLPASMELKHPDHVFCIVGV
jgi:hypothetical protein